jgi:multicomponent K+:H+ antiporter subunit E
MSRRLRFPVIWALLVFVWLALNGAVGAADVLIGVLVATLAVIALAAVETPRAGRVRVRLAVELLAVVLADVARSNLAVARIVLRPAARSRKAGFVTIPLRLRDPHALAVLACIITSTPGTAWAGYDSGTGVLTMHVLDLVDDADWAHVIRDRYERRLLELFE